MKTRINLQIKTERSSLRFCKNTVVVAATLLCSPVMATSGEGEGSDLQIKPYGFVKASAVYSTKALSSYGFQNHTADTETTFIPDESPKSQATKSKETGRTSLQTDQSRLGFKVNHGNVEGTLEFDFIAFDQSQPLGSAALRIRLANIVYRLDGLSLYAGEGWSHFSGQNPSTYNFVGNLFRSGNTGFLSRELAVRFDSPLFYLALAAGEHRNRLASDGGVRTTNDGLKENYPGEISDPSLIGSLAVRWQGVQLGYAGITQEVAYENTEAATDTTKNNVLIGQKGFAAYEFARNGEKLLDLRAEYYDIRGSSAGHFLLNLADSNGNRDQRDKGYYVSAKLQLPKDHGYLLGYGRAALEDIRGKASAAALVANETLFVAYDYSISPGLGLFLQITQLKSGYLRSAGTEDVKTIVAQAYESGMVFKF